jgi:NAD(P)-dependent dehydrogenase (short-subunit alcohol dehydrogenase family)
MSMLTGKIALITGATSGIGEITARELAWLGATVLVNGRNPAKLDATLAMIREAVPGADVHGMQYDLSSLAQVHALAEDVLTHFDRLDILVNNAGMMYMDERHSADGFELQFAVNHLSHFLLTHLLLPRMQATAQQYGEARIINVSSDAHKGAHIDWDTFGHSGKGFGAYSQTKLANVYFTYELARRLAGTGVTANALHPGFVATGFAKTENPGYMKMAMALLKPLAKTPAKGAETMVYLSSAPELTGVTGRYFANKKDTPSSKVSYDESEQRRLWSMSEEMAGLTTPEAAAAAV